MNKKVFKHIIICWLILMIVYVIDMYTTFRGIQLGAEEVNPIGAYFFRFGGIGYLYMIIFGGILFFITLIFLINYFLSWLYKVMYKKKMSDKFKIFLCYLFVSVFVLFESYMIWSNIKVIISLSGG